MKYKKIGIAVLLLLVPLFVLLRAGIFSGGVQAPAPGGNSATFLEQLAANGIPAKERLKKIGLQLVLLGGQTQQNDIFISENGLIKNIDPSNNVRIEKNVESIIYFAGESEISTYLVLIPTASAILQEQLPPYTELYNNQKQTIEEIYRKLSGAITTIDVYAPLFNRRDQYIYYRTQNNLTALGGYYVYAALGARLMGQEIQQLKDYNIEYLAIPYYGDLYQKSPYPDVAPDVISMFHYNRHGREYIVSHYGVQNRTYHTLHPAFLADLGRPMDVYLGGISAVTDIRSSSPYARSLLVFGDETALAYLPFLASNYERITLVDLFQLTQEQRQVVSLPDYDQVLFAYSVENFNSDLPARALQLLEE